MHWRLWQLPLSTQAKLLRVVETGDYLPLGSVTPARSRARILAATNADLRQLVQTGRFRKDLFYRLGVIELRTPALHEVRGDIPSLAAHIIRRTCARLGEGPPTLSPEASAALVAAEWPGNVRQLMHELERALLRWAGIGPALRREHLSPELRREAAPEPEFLDLGRRLVGDWEREEIRRGLQRTGGNVSRLARELGLSRTWLITKMRRHGLRRDGDGDEALAAEAG